MIDNTVEYNKQIESVLKKYGSGIHKDSLDDIRQDIRVSILTCKTKMTKKLAAGIARKKIIEYVQKLPPRCEDISDTDTKKKFDFQHVHFPDIDRILDSQTAVEFVYKLPEPYKSVILYSYGLEDELTDKQIATRYKKSEAWVYSARMVAIQKLRVMMGEE
jgi:DNA-directed RNA polymerase specialized sigma24 family protein